MSKNKDSKIQISLWHLRRFYTHSNIKGFEKLKSKIVSTPPEYYRYVFEAFDIKTISSIQLLSSKYIYKRFKVKDLPIVFTFSDIIPHDLLYLPEPEYKISLDGESLDSWWGYQKALFMGRRKTCPYDYKLLKKYIDDFKASPTITHVVSFLEASQGSIGLRELCDYDLDYYCCIRHC